MRRFGMSMSMSSQRRRRSRSQAEIVWELFVMAWREATAAGLVRIVVCLRISVARRPTGCGSNVTRCVKIIDFPWLDCCWLSKFNHNMQQRKRKRAREWEKRQREGERDRTSCCSSFVSVSDCCCCCRWPSRTATCCQVNHLNFQFCIAAASSNLLRWRAWRGRWAMTRHQAPGSKEAAKAKAREEGR